MSSTNSQDNDYGYSIINPLYAYTYRGSRTPGNDLPHLPLNFKFLVIQGKYLAINGKPLAANTYE